MDGLSVFLLWLAALVPPVALAIAGNRLTRHTPTEHAVAAYWSAGLALTVLAGPAVMSAAGTLAAMGSSAPAALGEGPWLVMVAALTCAGLTFLTTVTLGAELLFLLHRPPAEPPAPPAEPAFTPAPVRP
ncbi:hypothetical protein [Catenuloplanes japonicus]|uniref:hypothetical protein n=1 Tax=Catenuloplanes japonicus TaxID=33876 RepID=UPI0005262E6C|nr:hypothetical protein [Catenuloplanes japonicus]